MLNIPLCTCWEGYEGNPPFFPCEDIDECVSATICGSHEECVNSEGSYTCICESGFTQNPQNRTDVDCIDIDECTDANLNDCDVNAKCLNLEGSFNCTCEDGFEGNGEYCHPVFVATEILISFLYG